MFPLTRTFSSSQHCIWSDLIIYLLVSCNKQFLFTLCKARYGACLHTFRVYQTWQEREKPTYVFQRSRSSCCFNSQLFNFNDTNIINTGHIYVPITEICGLREIPVVPEQLLSQRRQQNIQDFDNELVSFNNMAMVFALGVLSIKICMEWKVSYEFPTF